MRREVEEGGPLPFGMPTLDSVPKREAAPAPYEERRTCSPNLVPELQARYNKD
jgi:hypothetical protein